MRKKCTTDRIYNGSGFLPAVDDLLLFSIMEPLQYFLQPKYSRHTLHQYALRRGILASIQKGIQGASGRVLDIGCGRQPYKSILLKPCGPLSEYVGMDLAESNYYDLPPDITWDGAIIPCPDNSFDVILCTEVLEHVRDPATILREANRVLKPGGTIVITTPFLWVLHEVPNDYQRLTPFSLDLLLRETGFSVVHIDALGGFDASLAQMLGLWVVLRPMKPLYRRMCKRILGPIVRLLNTIDRAPKEFTHCSMITGMSAVAKK